MYTASLLLAGRFNIDISSTLGKDVDSTAYADNTSSVQYEYFVAIGVLLLTT